jgi:competence ComEA-like helix-hairpin-helix protein
MFFCCLGGNALASIASVPLPLHTVVLPVYWCTHPHPTAHTRIFFLHTYRISFTMKVKKFFWDYLYFTRVERNGIILLVCTCLFLLALPCIYGYFFSKKSDISHQMLFESNLPLSSDGTLNVEEQTSQQRSIMLFHFNPNTCPAADFKSLGLSEKTIKSILNYRSKGGKFKQPDDFSKIYTLSEEDFQRLRPWITIGDRANDNAAAAPQYEQAQETFAIMKPFDPNLVDAAMLSSFGLSDKTISGWLNYRSKGGYFRQKEDVKKLFTLSDMDYQRLYPFMFIGEKATTEVAANQPDKARAINISSKRTIASVDINSAEIEDLVQLPGIGEGWAKRILNWREKLGGFSRIEQVGETRMLPDSVFQKVRPFLQVQAQTFKKISLNTATWDELNEHPYIESKQARWIIAFREQHGRFRSVEELLQIIELKKDWLEKVRPYLAV